MSNYREDKRLTRDLAAALVLLVTTVGGILLVYFFRSTSGLAWPGYVGLLLGLVLIGVSLLLSFIPFFRQISPLTWAFGLIFIIVLTILTPTSAYNQSYTFALDTSKIKTDLSSLPANGKVVVVLLVNNQEYSFNAQIYQTSIFNNGIPTSTVTSTVNGTPTSTVTPIACQTGLPTSATITPVPSPVATSSPAVIPCLNTVISTISVTLTGPTSAQLTNFTNLLPNASTIYLYPDMTSTPGA